MLKLTPEIKATMISLRGQGLTYPAIAKHTGFTKGHVWHLFKTGFASLEPKGRYTCSVCGGPTRSESKICSSNTECRLVYMRERMRDKWTQYTYGISPEEHQNLYDAQEGKCALCNRPQTIKELRVDHNHDTGEIRGLLCHRCNLGLGMFLDDETLLKTAAGYVGRFSTQSEV